MLVVEYGLKKTHRQSVDLRNFCSKSGVRSMVSIMEEDDGCDLLDPIYKKGKCYKKYSAFLKKNYLITQQV